MDAATKSDLKKKIKREAIKLGMNLIGFANVERWSEFDEINPAYYPQTIWPWSKTVIVLAVQIYLPMIETTPSVQHYQSNAGRISLSACQLSEPAWLSRSLFPARLLRRHFRFGQKAGSCFLTCNSRKIRRSGYDRNESHAADKRIRPKNPSGVCDH